MVIVHVNLLLLTVQCFAADIARYVAGIEYPKHRLQILVDRSGCGHHAGWWRFRLQAHRHRRRPTVNVRLLVTQHWVAGNICPGPFVLVTFVLTFGQQPFGFGRQSNRFGHAGAPVVIHSARIFGEPHQTVFFALVVDDQLGAVDRHNRNKPPRPDFLVQHFHRGDFAPFDLLPEAVALVNHRDTGQRHRFGTRQLILEYRRAIRQHQQLGFDALGVKIFGNPNILFAHPLGPAVAGRSGFELPAVVCIWILFVEYRFRDHRGDQASLGVRSIRLRAVGIEIDGKRVVDLPDIDLLVE